MAWQQSLENDQGAAGPYGTCLPRRESGMVSYTAKEGVRPAKAAAKMMLFNADHPV